MLKVRNRKVVEEIARITYKANKKRNLLTIFAIILTTFLIAVVMALGMSYWNTLSLRNIRTVGMDYDIELSEPREDQVEIIRSMDKIKYAGVAVKCAIVEQYQDKLLDKMRLYYLDKICWEKQTIPALEEYQGTYPQKENEIMLSTTALDAMGIKNPNIGQELCLTYITLSENSSDESLEKNFVLCGYYRDYSGNDKGYISKEFFHSTGVKQTDFTQGLLKISLKNPLYSEQDIIDIQNEIKLARNQYLSADYDTISNFCKMILILLVILIMIFVSGYLFIYNTLYIFISKDIRYYGQLKTIGMTSIQLRKIIYRQIILNSVIGIPIGLLASLATAKTMIPRILSLANPALDIEDIVTGKIWVFFLAGGFAFLTNMISSQKPAKMAGDCSPIEALRYTIGKKQTKDRKREQGSLYFMALQNIFRDKKQAVVIFSSFIIAISVFLVVNVMIRGNDMKRILNELWTYDIQFKNETMLEEEERQIITEEKIKQIEEISDVESVRKVTSAEAVIPYQEDVFEQYYKELYQSRYSPGNYEEDMKLWKENYSEKAFSFNTRLIGIDEKGFELLNEQAGNVINREDFEDGKIAIAANFFGEGDSGITGKTVRFSLPDGIEPKKEYSIKIAFVGDSRIYNPAYYAGGYTPDLIVSENYAKKLLGNTVTELIDVVYKKTFSKETEKLVKAVFKKEKEISNDSKLQAYSEMKSIEVQVKILGGSLGFIIALLAVLNYMNMMVASVQNRSREFATLESIGMTTGQIKKMLRLEGAGYAGISSLISLGIGLPLSYIVFNNMKIFQNLYSIPWIYNFILFAIIIVLCITLPVIIYQKTQKESIIERLRVSENL